MTFITMRMTVKWQTPSRGSRVDNGSFHH